MSATPFPEPRGLGEAPGFNQLSAHGAKRVDLPGRHGPVAALDRHPAGEVVGTVLLVPGYTGSKEDFAPIVPMVAEAGYRVVSIDQPGQYESPGPDDEDAYLPAALGLVVADLIAELKSDIEGPLILLGHSYGGLVARSAVLAGADVAGLTLLCSGPAAFHTGPRLDALRESEIMLRAHGLAAAYGFREALTEELAGAQEQDLAAFRRTRFLRSSAAGLLGMGGALLNEPNRTHELAATGVQTQVVAGVDDNAWPFVDQAQMARALGTELILIPSSAHSPAIENPAGLMQVLLPQWRAWAEAHTRS
ncbi:alpha/beta hydrolase [Nakamurella antarctica]|uniref:Alpha/beta hydrolase n=1 Tax=Nakamurella antarctica TaxID=1902245 RepID=A0A3G8ZLB8_9ACTN|nr:alpha/beta hydrolase [Nakamurella antarctica]AZI58119.1 alpha/beta hydrolase [Nakamurella antarctica]